jgi:hypothetical protein
MKKYNVVLALFVFLLIGCGSTKTVATETVVESTEEQPTNSVVDENIFIGTVKLYKSNCNVLIELIDSDAVLYPVNLDDMFMVDNAVIEFKFGPTRAMQPEECGNVKAVAVRDVVRLKN